MNKKNLRSALFELVFLIGCGLFAFSLRPYMAFYIIPSSSMEATLKPGDIGFGTKARQIQRGDILSFRMPEVSNKTFVKRVIGLPGETIQVVEGVVYIDGVLLVEDYISSTDCFVYNPVTLKEDEYYMLGDNRGNSADSRDWGPVKKDAFIHQFRFCLFPISRIGSYNH